MNSTRKIAFLGPRWQFSRCPLWHRPHQLLRRRRLPAQTIQDRKENQQDRIAQGVKSGELTAGETTNLEKKEADVNHEEHDMRKDG